MSSRKDLKKVINNSMQFLEDDCAMYIIAFKEPEMEEVKNIVDKIKVVRQDLLSRLSTSEGKDIKGRTKTYYRKLKEDLKKEIDALGKQIEDLH